jgi:ribosomal protein L29
MIASEIREKSDQELKDVLVELRKEQFGLRMQRGLRISVVMWLVLIRLSLNV